MLRRASTKSRSWMPSSRRRGATPHYIFPKAEDVFRAGLGHHLASGRAVRLDLASSRNGACSRRRKRAGIKVMLDGQGADEQLAGYHSSFPYYMSDLIRRSQWIMRCCGRSASATRMHGVPVCEQVQHFVGPAASVKVAAMLMRQQAAPSRRTIGSELRGAARRYATAAGALETASELLGLPPITDIASLCLVADLRLEPADAAALGRPQQHGAFDRGAGAVPRSPARRVLIWRSATTTRSSAATQSGSCGAQWRVSCPRPVRERRDKLGFSTPEEIWFRGPLRGAVLDGIEATLRRYPDLLNAERDARARRPTCSRDGGRSISRSGASSISASGASGSASRCRREGRDFAEDAAKARV